MTEPPADGSTTLLLPRWVVVVAGLVVVLLVVVLLQLSAVRRDQRALAEQVSRVATAPGLEMGTFGMTTTTTQVLDLPPPDAEASRRAINDAYRAVFSPATTPEQWAGLVSSPGDLGERLGALRDGPCAAAVPVLSAVRFTGDDDAQVDFGFTGVQIAEGVAFRGGAVREGGTWKVTPQTVESVLGMAESACAPS